VLSALASTIPDQTFSNCGARHPGEAVGPRGGGVDCMSGILILNEIRAKRKIYILTGTSLG
jgi:hypothetical protein